MDDQVTETTTPDLVPARIVNEHVYCPRLAYLEWVQGEFRHSADTLDGAYQHRRVDREEGPVPPPDDLPEDLRQARSVLMSAPALGVIARMDLLEMEGGRAVPVDTKRGRAPSLVEGAWEPDQVQVALQVLVLRENGYPSPHGVVYYAGSRKRVVVDVDAALEARARNAVAEVRATARRGVIPPPLVDSPKCPRCSLVGICLPDEVRLEVGEVAEDDVRRLFPARDDLVPLYVQEQGARVTKSGDRLRVVLGEKTVAEARLMELSHLAVYGRVQVTTEALSELLARDVPTCFFSFGGWFRGMTRGFSRNVELRMAQHRVAQDEARSLAIARAVVHGKVLNQRTLLRRNATGDVEPALDELRRLANAATCCAGADALLGIEGAAAKVYFAHFTTMLKAGEGGVRSFDFATRNRRPPRDPVNALLSFAYALLTKDLTVTAEVVGLDPQVGFYHRPRPGRPGLALDLVEEFRSIVADSVVIGVVNNEEVRPSHFVARGGACNLTPHGRKAFIAAYERRMDTLVRHPRFGYSIAYRRVLEVQARLLARHLTGELPAYHAFRTR
jgi:CRISPR-associated endonuclease Cas1/CRISPR-associated protein Cas4